MPRPDPPVYEYALLRAWRDEAGCRRERVALDLDLSATYLARLETGARTASLDTLAALAAYYGHPLGELFAVAQAAS